MPHLFDCVFHYISHNLYLVLLSQSNRTADRLASDSGIPLWLEDVDSTRCGDIYSKKRKKEIY